MYGTKRKFGRSNTDKFGSSYILSESNGKTYSSTTSSLLDLRPKGEPMLQEIKKNCTGHGLLIEKDGYAFIDENLLRPINEADGHIISNESSFSQIGSLSNGEWKVPNPFIVSAVFQKFDIENANGRIYPERVLKREVDKYIKNYIEQNCAIGVLEHPDTSSLDGKEISHNILELHWEGHTLVGKMQILTSEGFRKYGIISCNGDQVANLLLSGIKIGVSSRGIGTVEEFMGKTVVSDDFDLICWDVVCTPSTPGSWIAMEKEELGQYVESDNSRDKQKRIAEKIEKLQSLVI